MHWELLVSNVVFCFRLLPPHAGYGQRCLFAEEGKLHGDSPRQLWLTNGLKNANSFDRPRNTAASGFAKISGSRTRFRRWTTAPAPQNTARAQLSTQTPHPKRQAMLHLRETPPTTRTAAQRTKRVTHRRPLSLKSEHGNANVNSTQRIRIDKSVGLPTSPTALPGQAPTLMGPRPFTRRTASLARMTAGRTTHSSKGATGSRWSSWPIAITRS